MLAPPNYGSEYAARFNSIYPDLAKSEGVALYPFFLDGVAADARLNQADGIHPTAEGVGIIVNNIMPTVEAFLGTHPAVKVVSVVGVPDEKYQEVPAAFVERVPGATVTEEELIGHCKGQIASFKVPRYVRFVEEWPISATKIQKFRLRDSLVSELGL